MNELGKKMFDRRKELGLTLEDVGNAVGVGKSTVRKWEQGMIKNMGRDKIALLAEVLQMSPVEFVPGNTPNVSLSSDEQFVVDTYRSLSDPGKQYIHQQLTIASHMFGGKSDDIDQAGHG